MVGRKTSNETTTGSRSFLLHNEVIKLHFLDVLDNIVLNNIVVDYIFVELQVSKIYLLKCSNCQKYNCQMVELSKLSDCRNGRIVQMVGLS